MKRERERLVNAEGEAERHYNGHNSQSTNHDFGPAMKENNPQGGIFALE